MIVFKVILESLVIAAAYTGCMAIMIRKGATPLVFLYPQEVQEIAIAGGRISRKNKTKPQIFMIFS